MIVLNQRLRNDLRCLKYWLYTKICFARSLKIRNYLRRLENWLYIKILVPSFSECCDIVKSLAPRLGRTQRLISWDLSVDEKGKPVLIEGNLTYGALDFHQMCNGPLFGRKTEDVLKSVLSKQR